MNEHTVPSAIQNCYRSASIRGQRISRLEEKVLGRFRLDEATAWELGSNHVGVFIGGCEGLGAIIEYLRQLEQPVAGERWIVVAATKKMAGVITQRWCPSDQEVWVSAASLKLPKVLGSIILATPESLCKIDEADRNNVAGIVVVDTLCHIHGARGMQRENFFVRNDRPQLVADFRNSITHASWLPPLIFMARKRAKSVETHRIARAYCLEAWWFVDGKSLTYRRAPVAANDALPEVSSNEHAG